MFDYIPTWVRSLAITAVLTVISLGITIGIPSIIQNPSIDFTVLVWNDEKSGISKIKTIVQNVGDAPATNISILYNTGSNYDLISFNSTDATPRRSDELDNQLRINIERLSPQSFAILVTEGRINNQINKTIWLTSDSESKILTLSRESRNIGITSMGFFEDKYGSLLIEAGFGLFFVLIFRYFNFHKSEFLRKNYLGKHKIRLIKFNSGALRGSIVILLISGTLAYVVDYLEMPLPERLYERYKVFELDENITVDRFLQFKDPNVWYPASAGNLVLALGIFVAFRYSTNDIRLPKVIWSLKSSLPDITLNQISESYVSSEEVSMSTKQKDAKSDTEVFIVKNNDEVVGLISVKEIGNISTRGKPTFGSILRHKDLGNPHWDNEKMRRDNFVIVSNTMTLSDLKNEMEKSKLRFAVVKNSDKGIVGVVDYDRLFIRNESEKSSSNES